MSARRLHKTSRTNSACEQSFATTCNMGEMRADDLFTCPKNVCAREFPALGMGKPTGRTMSMGSLVSDTAADRQRKFNLLELNSSFANLPADVRVESHS